MLTAAEVGERLAVPPKTILNWAGAGILPGYKLGTMWRFREDEITAWLEARKVTTEVGR